MLYREVYRKLVAKGYDFSEVPGYAEGKFASLTADAVFAAMYAHQFSRNPALEPDDYFQEMMLKSLEKPKYYDAAKKLRSAVYSTTRNIAIDGFKKGRDWTKMPPNLKRVSPEESLEIPYQPDFTAEEEAEDRVRLARSVVADLREPLSRQMDTELVRSNPDNPLTIEETAKVRGVSRRAVTEHRRLLKKRAWGRHADTRRQLFGPHRATKSESRRKRREPNRARDRNRRPHSGCLHYGHCVVLEKQSL